VHRKHHPRAHAKAEGALPVADALPETQAETKPLRAKLFLVHSQPKKRPT